MAYEPKPETATLLRRALAHINSVPYQVSARWVFYRLLQDGSLEAKGDYKKLLSLLSKARKAFYGGWRPDTLIDESRGANVRGNGFDDGQGWLQAMSRQECFLDRWSNQPGYVEVWFEAAAMEQQFSFYTDENVPLLAFHGDVSIPEKWTAATRLWQRWHELQVPITVLYYGDLDPKGLQIPESARTDVVNFACAYAFRRGDISTVEEFMGGFYQDFTFLRVGLNEEHVQQYDIMENPERPDTYQWEGLEDDAAQELIAQVDSYLDKEAFEEIMSQESNISSQYREHVLELELAE